MKRGFLKLFLFLLFPLSLPGDDDFANLKAPVHGYWERPLRDPFSLKVAQVREGGVRLDHTDEKAFLKSLLEFLEIPATSQLWVFSTTSLQLSLISPRNPRAVYFNEEIYVGFIPGGKIEIISMDPDLGGIFYIFDIPRPDTDGMEHPIVFERSSRCMNCHSDTETRDVPGLAIRSVLPGPRGGSMDAFRRDQTGHQIPLDQRFGGWHVTGAPEIGKHWGNMLGNFTKDGLVTTPVEPCEHFDADRYLCATSDILPHLLLEHQAGFINRVLEATYRSRFYASAEGDVLADEQEATLDRLAAEIVRYLLFADEAKLPPGSVAGERGYREAFLAGRKADDKGRSLRDFDLRDRLFKYRCSYMIYSNVFSGLPEPMRRRVFGGLRAALSTDGDAPAEYAYLPEEEKQAIRAILSQTLAGWQRNGE